MSCSRVSHSNASFCTDLFFCLCDSARMSLINATWLPSLSVIRCNYFSNILKSQYQYQISLSLLRCPELELVKGDCLVFLYIDESHGRCVRLSDCQTVRLSDCLPHTTTGSYSRSIITVAQINLEPRRPHSLCEIS